MRPTTLCDWFFLLSSIKGWLDNEGLPCGENRLQLLCHGGLLSWLTTRIRTEEKEPMDLSWGKRKSNGCYVETIAFEETSVQYTSWKIQFDVCHVSSSVEVSHVLYFYLQIYISFSKVVSYQYSLHFSICKTQFPCSFSHLTTQAIAVTA